MNNRYYTKYPNLKRIFLTSEQEEKFNSDMTLLYHTLDFHWYLGSIDDDIFSDEIAENIFYERKFYGDHEKFEIWEKNYAQRQINMAINSNIKINTQFAGHQSDFAYYPLNQEYLSRPMEEYFKFFLRAGHFNTPFTYQVFATAFDDMTYNENRDLSRNNQIKAVDTFTRAVENGLNIENVKLTLAKILNTQTENMKKGFDYKHEMQHGMLRTNNLLTHAEEICKEFSPYEQLFKIGEEIGKLKKEQTLLEKQNPQDEKIEEIENQILDKQSELKKEIKQFDVALLEDVVNDREEYYMEISKNMALVRNQNFDIYMASNSAEYAGILEVGKYVGFEKTKQQNDANKN